MEGLYSSAGCERGGLCSSAGCELGGLVFISRERALRVDVHQQGASVEGFSFISRVRAWFVCSYQQRASVEVWCPSAGYEHVRTQMHTQTFMHT